MTFLIMQSNGGGVRHATAGERPVTMLLSGSAAGVLGAVHMARLAGFEDVLTLDMSAARPPTYRWLRGSSPSSPASR